MPRPLPPAVAKPAARIIRAARRVVPAIVVDIRIGRLRDYPAPRDFAMATVQPDARGRWTVTVSPRLALQSRARISGILAHELGHVVLAAQGRPAHTEVDADAMGSLLLGRCISYDSEDVQVESLGACRRRPGHLHA